MSIFRKVTHTICNSGDETCSLFEDKTVQPSDITNCKECGGAVNRFYTTNWVAVIAASLSGITAIAIAGVLVLKSSTNSPVVVTSPKPSVSPSPTNEATAKPTISPAPSATSVVTTSPTAIATLSPTSEATPKAVVITDGQKLDSIRRARQAISKIQSGEPVRLVLGDVKPLSVEGLPENVALKQKQVARWEIVGIVDASKKKVPLTTDRLNELLGKYESNLNSLGKLDAPTLTLIVQSPGTEIQEDLRDVPETLFVVDIVNATLNNKLIRLGF